jgi:hypothetical protein
MGVFSPQIKKLPMAKKYVVTLTPAEREYLQQLTSKGKNPVYKVIPIPKKLTTNARKQL